MGIKVRYIKGVGLVQSQTSATGNEVDLTDASTLLGASPGPRDQDAQTADVTLTSADAGMHTLSGSGTGVASNDLTITLPDPANVPLAIYGFRMEDARNHVISSSAGPSVLAFVPASGSYGAAAVGALQHASHVSMSAAVGSSVLFQSDGLHYLAYAGSGSHTFVTD